MTSMVVNTEIMAPGKKRRGKVGRPAGRSGRPFQMRVTDQFLTDIDNWRRQQADLPNRSEAIRRLIEQALGGRKGKQ